jgi:hypothetical protein
MVRVKLKRLCADCAKTESDENEIDVLKKSSEHKDDNWLDIIFHSTMDCCHHSLRCRNARGA